VLLLVGQVSGSVRIHSWSAKIPPHEFLESLKEYVFHRRCPMKSCAMCQGAYEPDVSQRAFRCRKRSAK
jgi:hypothetical protein